MRAAYATLVVLAGCAAPATVPPPGMHYDDRPPMAIVVSPHVPVPENDIPESQRREWYEAQRPAPAPVTAERVVEQREPQPVYDHGYDQHCDSGWLLPFSIGLGFWGSHGHDHGHGSGWGWGLGLGSGWGNGWCW